jgi:hypothetical protein
MADREQRERERESRESDETKFDQAREEQREEVAEHADEVRRLPDPEPQQDSE